MQLLRKPQKEGRHPGLKIRQIVGAVQGKREGDKVA
jgi:hypothetical protein